MVLLASPFPFTVNLPETSTLLFHGAFEEQLIVSVGFAFVTVIGFDATSFPAMDACNVKF